LLNIGSRELRGGDEVSRSIQEAFEEPIGSPLKHWDRFVKRSSTSDLFLTAQVARDPMEPRLKIPWPLRPQTSQVFLP